MRVRVLKDTSAYYNYEVRALAEGEVVGGDLARLLADNSAEGTVEVLDDDREPPPAADDADPGDPGDAENTGDADPPAGLDPDGTAAEILAWVGDDPERAAEALDAEQAKGGEARSTLVKKLAKLSEPAE